MENDEPTDDLKAGWFSVLAESEYPDLLWIFPLETALAEEERWYRYRYRIDLAPDYYHKADVSGGPPYTIYAPDAAADVNLHHEPHRTTFVSYLRRCFQASGFLGIASLPPWLLPDGMFPLLPI